MTFSLSTVVINDNWKISQNVSMCIYMCIYTSYIHCVFVHICTYTYTYHVYIKRDENVYGKSKLWWKKLTSFKHAVS